MAETQERQDNRKALVPVDMLAPMRLPVTPNMLDQLGLDEGDYRVLTDQIFPGARTVEAIAMALRYCKHRNLDIYKRVVHIVPMYSAALRRMVETCWPGIAEIRTTATRTAAYAGIDDSEYGPLVHGEFMQTIEDEFRQPKDITKHLTHPEWCKVVVYRLVGGQRFAFHARVFWMEAYATTGRGSEMPNSMWFKRPYGQIEKCAEAAALRRAFPEELGGEYAAEEMAGKELTDETIEYTVIPERKPAPRPPRKPEGTAQPNPKTAANAQPGQPGGPSTGSGQADQIVDVDEVDDFDSQDNADLADDTAFFNKLRDAMNGANDAATVEEIWIKADPMAKFEGDETSQTICQKIKSLRLKQIAGK
jgi:phage recombination protein Bet